MVLTVTLNPLLERRYTYPKILFEKENRNGSVLLKAGGKGLNVSRQLNKFNVQNIALTFTGGANGKSLRSLLRNEAISFSDISTKTETRDAVVIIEESTGSVTTFFGSNQLITKTEKEKFLTKLEKIIANCEYVVFAGSSPCIITDEIFPAGIDMANKLGKISVCDTYGEHLQNCLDASPTILHNNIDEIESSINLKLKNEDAKLNLLQSLYSKGIKQAFLTDGDKPVYASNFDFHYKVTLPKIDVKDATGSGDAFVAGVLYAWYKRLTFFDELVVASAIGVCNAQSFETCAVNECDVLPVKDKIKIEQVGKKIKTINDKAD